MTFQTFTGREYLKIDIASNFGLDKASWNQRIAWFDANEARLYEMMHEAEHPALFYAGVKAWEDVNKGLPIGHMISLDATSSGLQLLAALTGDLSAAKLCNVVDTGDRQDAYTLVYDFMCNLIGDESKISRDKTKDAIMTSLYGSKAVPKQVFGEGALLDVFYHSMQRLAPAVWELNEAMLALWNPEAFSHDWTLPDNFHVHVKVIDQVKETVHFMNEPFDVFTKVNQPMESGRSLGANTIHSIDGMIVREITRRCDYNQAQVRELRAVLASPVSWGISSTRPKDKMLVTLWNHFRESGYLSSRIMDYLDAGNMLHVDAQEITDLLESLPAKPFKVVSIHDCFRCLPHYGNDLRRQYNIQLAAIAKSDLLSSLLSQLVGHKVRIGKLHDIHADVLETNYALS